jgi:hypothetical protein
MPGDERYLAVMPEKLRFLELGVDFLFKYAYPAQTDAFYCGTWHESRYGAGEVLGPRNLWKIVGKLRRGEYDLVIAHPPLYAPWHPRSFLSMLKYRQASYPVGLFSHYAWQFLIRTCRAPMVAVDKLDSFGIGRHNNFLFDRCRAYYKRELPTDNWLVFYGTSHRNLPGGSFRSQDSYQRYLEKLRPMSIGIHPMVEKCLHEVNVGKQTDVFFAGVTQHSSTARARGISQILALRERGVVVDIPEQPLPREEFLKRCAEARIVWSPAGFGWDCYRHYEAALAGSVPLMNTPTIERHFPLMQGVHALYYDVEGDGLTRTVMEALRDRPRLEQMGRAAREYASRHHTLGANCRHIVSTVLPEKVAEHLEPKESPVAERRVA